MWMIQGHPRCVLYICHVCSVAKLLCLQIVHFLLLCPDDNEQLASDDFLQIKMYNSCLVTALHVCNHFMALELYVS